MPVGRKTGQGTTTGKRGQNRKTVGQAKTKGKPRTLADILRRSQGQAKGLPADASMNHDHYLYGAPKRS